MFFFDPRTVLTLASRAFAFYYTLQYMMTFNVSRDRYQRVGITLVAVAMEFNSIHKPPRLGGMRI